MRETLRKLDLKITELADYLKISRPTMYKYIDCFESRDYRSIDPNILKLFQYIEKNKDLIGKRNVVNFILTNSYPQDEAVKTPEAALLEKFAAFLKKNGADNVKVRFLALLLDSKAYDKLIPYLVDVAPLLSKKELSEEEQTKLEPLLSIYQQEGLEAPGKKNTSGGK
jgi:DNA-binding MarR family transcriptional regulator